jgi:hypothetical protein
MDRPVLGSVPNYLAPAILSTLFCCLPFGIVAIIYAAQVDSKVAAGDYAGALDSSNRAKTWSIASAVSAAVLVVLFALASR